MMGFEVTGGEWLLICLLGALVGLDAVSWPQAMWSRPIFAGTLGGMLFGGPAEGFFVGAWLEILTSRHPPFGAARYPETGPAALVAGAAYALAGERSLPALTGAVLLGWTIGWIGMHAIARLRETNARLVADPASFEGRPSEVARRHRLAIRLDALRAGVIAGALLVPGAMVVRLAGGLASDGAGQAASRGLVVAALALLTGTGARSLGTRRGGWPAIVAGAAVGAAIVWGLS